ncbi:MAG: hypothetical protein S4CHLAM20_01260 [Chlamydiia bacterium]|nr:hypothetical protein [Chlamydiia bacterium]
MNDPQTQIAITPLLLGSLFYFLGFLVTTYFAKAKGFLTLPFKNYKGVFCSFSQVFIVLILFIFFYAFFTPFVFSFILKNYATEIRLALIPIFSFFLTIIAIYVFAKTQNFPLDLIWKDKLFPGSKSYIQDIYVGLIAFVLSLFPLFTVMALFEALFIWMNIDLSTQQSAIQYFLSMKESLITFLPAIFTIVIAAPIIEEFIFRGLLQTYLRKKYGSILSIIYASILFSVFHFSISQGIQNIAIIVSLFTLSLYLGFAYEKTRSLISSITLHVTFNLINVIKIIFYTT